MVNHRSWAAAAFLSCCSSVLAQFPVEFDKALIPVISSSLPLLSLDVPVAFPTEYVQRFVAGTSKNVTLTKFEDGSQYAYDGDGRLAGFINATTGEIKVFPNMDNVKPVEGTGQSLINNKLTTMFLSDARLFPKDHTNLSIAAGANLVGSTNDAKQGETPVSTYLSHAVIKRNINTGAGQIPVCGPGSKASFGYTPSGEVGSFSYQWNPAFLTGQEVKPNATDDIYKAIYSQLSSVAVTGPARVDGVDICFYDSGLPKKLMQPVYRFWATLNFNSTDVKNAANPASRIFSFVPLGSDGPNQIPNIFPPKIDTLPTLAPETQPPPPTQVGRSKTKRGVKPNISVGRYVVRDDTWAWVTNANNFWSSLTGHFGPISFSPIANFLNSQYYWAYPYLFTTSKNSFVNSVHLAETEVHGNWHLFSTEKNCCDLVSLPNIPADGYGGGAGGKLAYWIIHSCEVIPTVTDYPAAADKHRAWDDWWRLFNGLHAVVGYRTEMWIADRVMGSFGACIASGAGFVGAWLMTVHDDTASYLTMGKPQMYLDGNRGIMEPMGRASAVFVCGHYGDRVIDVANLGRPSCLTEMWYEN